MKKQTSMQLREKFLAFFKKHGHTIVPSSSLIPAQDPTLLFANAGMNQFKDVFLGKEKRSYTRAATIQKCMRAGGKHSDLDNVGFTKRHLTFFEMMGNFSFGDYFKKEAISFAWDFLVKELGFDLASLYATVYTDDDESYVIWHDVIGLPPERISRLGAADNFWQMGDIGPCGPCSEIYVDRGASFGCGRQDCAPACSCDRFLEVWNMVFTQYDRQPDGTDVLLEQYGVDTGMGMERLASIVQNVDSVFETDLFVPIIQEIEKRTKVVYATAKPDIKVAFHVLADHVRASTFLIGDGCAPSNEGRGYVLRKIIRRAALFARRLTDENIFPELADVVIQMMSPIYPELKVHQKVIKKVLSSEIEKFASNLVQGKAVLEQYLHDAATSKKITGEQAFKLYDTFGFPLELAIAFARERGYTVDVAVFEDEMEKQRERSGKKTADELDQIKLEEGLSTTFTGYQELETEGTVTALIHNNKVVDSVPAGQICWVIVDRSPFFIVGGGQVPDQGSLTLHDKVMPLLGVRYFNSAIGAQVKAAVPIRLGDKLVSRVDATWRINAMKNHTATHMLQSALIELFGNTIKQSGSLVHPDYLRFDFTYHENLSPEDIKRVEDRVNEKIRENVSVNIEHMTMPEALKRGALAFFGDKYNPEQVRLVEIPGYSAELCGGTHVPRTGDIGVFKITEVSALSAGQRRIVAVTGPRAVELFQNVFNQVKTLSQEFKVKIDEVVEAISRQKEQVKELQGTIKQFKKQQLRVVKRDLLEKMELVKKLPVLCAVLEGYGADEVRQLVKDMMRDKPGFYFIASNGEQSCNFVCAISPAYTDAVQLQTLNTWLHKRAHLRGGGKQGIIQGGGPRVSEHLCSEIKELLRTTLT